MQNFSNQLAKAERFIRDGNVIKAQSIYAAIHKLAPNNVQVGIKYLETLELTGSLAESLTVLENLNAKLPNNELLLFRAADLYIRLGRLPRAAEIVSKLEQVAANKPRLIRIKYSLESALGNGQQALSYALEAVKLEPDSARAFLNLGAAFSDLSMFDQADYAFGVALELRPDYVAAITNRAYIASIQGDIDKAIDWYEKGLALAQSSNEISLATIKFPLSFQYLSKGNLERGWEYYESGFDTALRASHRRLPNRVFTKPQWSGFPIFDKTIMVWREQGLGDELRFLTCLPDLLRISGKVVLEVDPRLVSILRRTLPDVTVRAANWSGSDGRSPLEDFDVHIPMGTLPKYFRRKIDDFYGKTFALTPIEQDVLDIRNYFSDAFPVGLKIGICWRSGKLSPVRNINYTNLADWADILSLPNCHFINLQYGSPEAELVAAESALNIKIHRWKDLDLKNDLEGVFALLSELDLVISVGSSIVNMAPLVGTETWQLRPSKPWIELGQENWPWMHNTTILRGDIKNGLTPALSKALEMLKNRMQL